MGIGTTWFLQMVEQLRGNLELRRAEHHTYLRLISYDFLGISEWGVGIFLGYVSASKFVSAGMVPATGHCKHRINILVIASQLTFTSRIIADACRFYADPMGVLVRTCNNSI